MTITASNLGMKIAGHEILSGISLTCEAGQVTALVGPSGSGKTTLLNCLGLLQRPSAGTITIDGQDATRWGERPRLRFWQREAAFIYQDYGLIDEENLAYNVTLRASGIFRPKARTNSRLTDILQTVGLAGRESDPVSVLSGGEKQRVGVARALYKEASYIFADEPTASLDAGNRSNVTRLLTDAAAAGVCVVIATHDDELAAAADTVYQL